MSPTTLATRHDPAQLDALYRGHIEHLQQAYGTALQDAGYDAVVIHSGSALQACPFDDRYWPLRPTPAFAHWLPLREPGCAVVITPGARPILYRLVTSDFWEGVPPAESDHFWAAFDVVEVDSTETLRQRLPQRGLAFIGSDVAALTALGATGEAINPRSLLAAFDQTRTIKTDYERSCLAEANRRAARGHAELIAAFAAEPASELALQLRYLAATAQDAMDTPYQNIVAIDEHAAVLHHVNYSRRVPNGAGGHSLLVDAGATYLGYASDITRTVVRGDDADARMFGQLIAAIETLQRAVCERIRVGMSYEDLHDHAHELLADVLRELGISRASADELVASGATRTFLPHGLGHSLGLQVHDVGMRLRDPQPRNPFLRNTSTIAAGQVFTIEPGCYFIGPLLDELRAKPVAQSMDWGLIERLSRFGGIRIEDNIAVFHDRTGNLTRDNWPDRP